MSTSIRVLVAGAGGFIGHHVVKKLKAAGYWVRGVDLKYPEYERTSADEFLILDLRCWESCVQATRGVDHVYQLAADMGGIGYITAFHADIATNNILISAHMLKASRLNSVSRFLYSSSACVYAQCKQTSEAIAPLKEEDAYPADPEPGYGWEKLYTEQLCEYFYADYGFETRIVRFHNVYGPLGTYDGGREKSPAAICRKVALAPDNGIINIWGDGMQTRSYMYIDDCVVGLTRLMKSSYHEPLNLGTDRLISINELADLVCRISGKQLHRTHDLTKPQGVRGRNSDNTRLRQVLGWEPHTPLEEGLTETYRWIVSELKKSGRTPAGLATAA